jgi:agmatine/peptidylarginine deiminase
MKTLHLIPIFIFLVSGLNAQQVYYPPEFAPQQGLLLTWDYHPQRNVITAAIARAVQPSATVWVIYYPGQAPMDTTEIRTYLRDHLVPDENVHLIPGWTETLWIRDYGPFAGYENTANRSMQRQIIDAGYSNYNRPNDDAIPTQIGNLWNIPVNDMLLQFEGGNLLTDGLGRGWSSTRIFSQNPNLSPSEVKAMMEQYFGLDEMMYLEALTHSGGGIWCHVDMFMKIIDSETILMSQLPDHVPDYALLESFVDTLGKITNSNGIPYKIIRIPAPPKADGTWATTQNDEMRTYTNSIIINDVVVIPSYDLPDYDSAAINIYRSAMPGYRLVMIDSRELTPLHGALHCISKEITPENLLHFNHQKIAGLQTFQDTLTISTRLFASVSPDSVFVFYRNDVISDFIKMPMFSSGDFYTTTLTNLHPTDTMQYYLLAKGGGAVVTQPMPAPRSYYTFWFDPSTSATTSVNQKRQLVVSPNPSAGQLQIALGGLNKCTADIMIFDMTSQRVHQINQAVLPATFSLPAALPNGLYTIVLRWRGVGGKPLEAATVFVLIR